MKIRFFFPLLVLLPVLLLAGCAKTEAKDEYEVGVQSLKNGSYESAAACFTKTVESGQYLPEAYRGLGIAQMYQRDYADACISLEKSLLNIDNQGSDFKKDVSLYLALCRTWHLETDKAIEIYSDLLKSDTDPEVLFLRGRLYMQNGDTESAKTDFDKAASLSTDYDLFINIYEVYAGCEKDADGADYLEKALKLAETESGSSYYKGLINYYLKDYASAKDDLVSVLTSDKNNTDAILLLGKVYLSIDDIADARAMFNDHIDDNSSAAAAYNGLALCDISEGSYDSALQNVESGLALGNDTANQSLRFNEIVIYEKLNDWSSAKKKCAVYVADYPTDAIGLRENEFLQSR